MKSIDLIKKKLHVDIANPDLLPLVAKLVPDYELVTIKKETTYEEVKAGMVGYRGATLKELVEWGEWDEKSEVIAVGEIIKVKVVDKETNVVTEEEFVPVLCRNGNSFYAIRKLALLNIKLKWFAGGKYLIIKNK